MSMKKILTTAACVLILVLTLFCVGCNPKYTDESVSTLINDNVAEVVAENDVVVANLNTNIADLNGKLEDAGTSLEDAQAIATQAIADLESAKDTEIDTLNSKLSELEAALLAIEDEAKATEAKLELEYTKDELNLDNAYNYVISDRDLKSLFDGEIDFDDDDYDAEEVIEATATVTINEADYEDNVYMTLAEGDISYRLIFENDLDTSKIDLDETLEFSFLGETVEVIDWDNDKITFFKGTEYLIYEGETIVVDDKTVTVEAIGEEKIFVKVTCDGVSESSMIEQDETDELCDIEIRAKDVFSDEDITDFVTIEIGNDVNNEVEDGDEYEEDSIWEWSIDANSIGLVLAEDFDEVDEDEDYQAITAGDSVCLPNDYVCVRFDGVSEEDSEDYFFEEDNDYTIELTGEIISGLNDYDRVFIDGTGFYDEDDDLIDAASVTLGDSGLVLNIVGSGLTVGDIKINAALSDVEVDGVSIANEDDNFITAYGIVIENPEDSLEDNEVSLIVPEEALEASITFVGLA